MTVSQLAEAIVIEPGDTKTDEAARLFNPCEVIGICGSLVTTSQSAGGEGVDDPGHMLVGFAHYSVKEFLVSDRIKTSSASNFSLDQVDGRINLTTINLTYLIFERYKSQSFPRSLIHLPEHVLYAHAALEWISHVTDQAVEAQILPHVLPLLTPTTSNQLVTWQSVTDRSGENPLWTAIENDWLLIAEHLLKAGADPNPRFRMEYWQCQKETPLTFAVHNRRTGAIKVLLRGGANPHVVDIHGHSPLFQAFVSGPGPWFEAGGTPFAMTGHPDPLEVMLECRHDDTDVFNPEDCGPAKYERFALMVLAKRIRCGVTSFSARLMYEAAGAGMTAIIAVLLRRGTDPNLQHDGKTPLHGVIRKLNNVADAFFAGSRQHITGRYVE